MDIVFIEQLSVITTIGVYDWENLNVPPFYLGIVAIAACLGHIYPVFFHFKGGKGYCHDGGKVQGMIITQRDK